LPSKRGMPCTWGMGFVDPRVCTGQRDTDADWCGGVVGGIISEASEDAMSRDAEWSPGHECKIVQARSAHS
jgi:hypothetical protein